MVDVCPFGPLFCTQGPGARVRGVLGRLAAVAGRKGRLRA